MHPTFWLTKASPERRARALWAAIFALVALFASCAGPTPPPRTTEGVAAMLGAAVGGEVRPDDFVWEARGGFLADAFLGRQVLFLARKPGNAAELYRARVRLTRAGHPLGLRMVRNLTQSPLGDEHDLVAQGHHAAYVTKAFGAVQGVTLLDLEGEGDAREARTRWQRAAAAIESWLTTGSTRGVGRTEITFGVPPTEARHELQGDLLVMALGKEALPAALDLRDGSLNTGAQNTFAASAQRIPHRAPAMGDVAARATSELLGEGAGAGVRAFAGSIDAVTAKLSRVKRVDATIEAGDAAATVGDTFPPAAIAPVIQPALAGEGVWTARGAVGRGEVKGAPAFAYETAIRPDPRAPESLVRLVALDTRQIDLRLAPGVDEPRSRIGLHGTGRPPEGLAADRMVAAFAGGPAGKATDANKAEPGFVAERRVLAAPVPGMAAIALTEDGRASLGAWPFGAEMAAPFVSLRQTPEMLVGSGKPSHEGSSEAGERSALGLLPNGQIVYAWSVRATPETLARALTLSGCTQAVPLAGGPMPSGFAYLRAGAPAEPVSRAMSLGPDQLAGRSTNDLFYAVLRNAGPPASGATLAPDAGRQPSPAWLPAIHTGVVTGLGAQIHVTTFAAGRLVFKLRPGLKEPATKAIAALPTTLTEGDQAKVMAAIGLGTGKRRGARGLIVEGASGLPVRSEDTGALLFDHGRPRVVKASEMKPSPGIDATELPLTADEGKLLPAARDVGSMRARAAACVLEDGTFAVAATTFDSDEAATTALLDLGCTRVVALDRGSHASAFLHRTGTDAAPQPRYETSAIFAVELPLAGRAGPLPAP
ncbi:Cobalt-zinc-cadmium resistance protein [Minicystis rosea]|nr:Cobalt-zinc-cadmium resistance protein [Minicystis rosea]